MKISSASKWIEDLCGAKKHHVRKAAPGIPMDTAHALERGKEICKTYKPATAGQGGNQTGFNLACRLRDVGLTEPTALSLASEIYNPRCEPPWELGELETIVGNAYRYAQNSPGCDTPENVFGSSYVEELNARYAVVVDEGTPIVVEEKKDPELQCTRLIKSSFHDFSNRGRNKPKIEVDGKKVNLHSAWLSNPKCLKYENGFAFLPERPVPPGYYNLWSGLNVSPRKGDWSRIKAHIEEVICSENSEHFAYVYGLMASAVQKPWERWEVALGLQGPRGVGKGIFARAFKSLFGRYYLHLANSEHLTGRFNSHLEGKLIVFADESFFAGDKSHEGVLKAIITEETFMSEAKFQNARQIKNYINLIMASNESHMVPAGVDERRFFMLKVSSRYQQDQNYFGKVIGQMSTGGIEAMLYDLLSHDLGEFNTRAVPKSAALTDQKIKTLKPPEQWLFQALSAGEILGADWANKAISLTKSDVYTNYLTFGGTQREFRATTRSEFYRAIRGILPFPLLRETRPDSDEFGERPRFWEFGPLAECRDVFEKHLRASGVDWETKIGGESE